MIGVEGESRSAAFEDVERIGGAPQLHSREDNIGATSDDPEECLRQQLEETGDIFVSVIKVYDLSYASQHSASAIIGTYLLGSLIFPHL